MQLGIQKSKLFLAGPIWSLSSIRGAQQHASTRGYLMVPSDFKNAIFLCLGMVWYGLNERVPLLVFTKTFLSLALQMQWARERKSDELAIAGSGAWRARRGRDITRSDDWHALCHPEPLRKTGQAD